VDHLLLPTEENPADLLTRGITSSQPVDHYGYCSKLIGPPPTIELQALAVTGTEFQPPSALEPDQTGRYIMCRRHVQPQHLPLTVSSHGLHVSIHC